MECLQVKNWKKFQHFKDRMPPWIKLYRDLLDDPDWYELDPKLCKLLIMLWLIASEDEEKEGCLPNIRKLSFRLRIPEHQLKQYLIKLEQWVDIKMISERYQDDTPETETETEKRESRAKPPQINIREFVKISEEDLKKLSQRFNKEQLEWMFDKLNFWRGTKKKQKVVNGYEYFDKGSWLIEEMEKKFNPKGKGYIDWAQGPDKESQEYRDKVLEEFTPEELVANRKRLAAISKATFKSL